MGTRIRMYDPESKTHDIPRWEYGCVGVAENGESFFPANSTAKGPQGHSHLLLAPCPLPPYTLRVLTIKVLYFVLLDLHGMVITKLDDP